ncbi:caspase family protein [Pedobacter sp. PLR]|uniref:caspase family protein n=1 Tax=Pedobacter sp. PLR TaxID=2994465 RepID=UPI002247569C|nr:caspase family protein [Pedobacter sp. PLR]MCX2454329.1 caspase family protein [Pedobacter sp. PLR]
MPNSRDYAVVVGLNHYKKLPVLNGPINDARRFGKWLTSPGGGDLPVANCKVIVSRPNALHPIQDDIDQALAEIIEAYQGDKFRRFYFFFAGHGIGLKWDVSGLCMPKWSDIFLNAVLSSKGYLDYIVASDFFEEAYFFLDCCRNRKSNVSPLPPTLGVVKDRGSCSSLIIHATDFENVAGEGLTSNGTDLKITGFFSQALSDGLNGAAVNANGEITIDGLIQYVIPKTEQLAIAQNMSQRVTYQFNNGGIDMNTPIVAGKKQLATQLTITFKKGGVMVLKNPVLEIIKNGYVLPGESWGPIPLIKGYYSITSPEKTDFVEIDGVQKTRNYEFG